MWSRLSVLLSLLLFCCQGCSHRDGAPVVVRERRALMGTFVAIQAVVQDPEQGRRAVEAAYSEIERVELEISEWKTESEISKVNRAAGVEPITVGPDLLAVLSLAARVSDLTFGAFDITFSACGRLWSFREQRIPSADETARCLGLVDYRRLQVRASGTPQVFLPEPGMSIGVGGIGKGYAVDQAARVLEEHGIESYIVDGGGDIRIRGQRPDRPWTLAIAHPRRKGGLYGSFTLAKGAVVTSGDYESSFVRDGVLYHHILDPRTGLPAKKSVAVTVLAPEAALADALATGLFVLGPEQGLALVEELPEVEALFFAPSLEVVTSSGFPDVRIDSL